MQSLSSCPEVGRVNRPWSTRRRRSRLARLVSALFALALLAGCGGGGDQPLSDTEHNDADAAFATEMIQHHAQALAMVNLTVQRPMTAEFQDLSEGIRAAQGPEIEAMVVWLEEWDVAVPETVNDHTNHDMGTMPEGTEDLPGMMSAAEMADLEGASDADFQRRWLEMMIRHHRGAIEMAEVEVDRGRYRPAVELARAIITAQQAEIAEMEALLDTA